MSLLSLFKTASPGVVMITGASSGIGADLARDYAKRGASLILCARRLDRLEALAEELKGVPVLTLKCDVRNEADLEACVRQGLEKFGRIDVVVANAGNAVYGTIESLSNEDFRRQFETNIYGVLNTVRAALPELKKTRGRLAILGSAFSYLTFPAVGPYTMSKYAVRALGETLRFELASAGISVTMVYPGTIATEFRMINNLGDKWKTKEAVPSFFLLSSEKAARQIRRAVDRRRRNSVITFHARFGIFMANHLPWVYDHVVGFFRQFTADMILKRIAADPKT